MANYTYAIAMLVLIMWQVTNAIMGLTGWQGFVNTSFGIVYGGLVAWSYHDSV
jgi:hypothetical protein